MITAPTTAQLVRSVRSELESRVLPEIADKALLVDLQMMLSVLDMVAVRADHEIGWMAAETESIAAAIEQHAKAHPLAEPVRAALDRVRTTRPADLSYAEMQRHYLLAGELLARASEQAGAGDEDLQPVVWQLLEQRLENELGSIGAFVAVGRTEDSVG